MTWYICDNAPPNPRGHAKPIFLQSAVVVPSCTECGAATVAAHQRVRVTHSLPGGNVDYTVRVNVNGDLIQLEVVVGNKTLLLPNDVLPYDAATGDIVPGKQLTPPGGGQWTHNPANYGGGRAGIQNAPAVPQAVCSPVIKLGQNDPGDSYGVVHVLKGHPEMFKNGLGMALSLANFKANLLQMTEEKSQGKGVRVIARQTDNARYGLHGVRTGMQRAMYVVKTDKALVTAFDSQQLSGLSHNPVKIRDWN